ncbi:MAG: CPBP family intramembrane metalloprotease [Euryarchaeota archaeon]|nr:CPBP family intramembrane metalloprotease [Euryarchaeota archaeon]
MTENSPYTNSIVITLLFFAIILFSTFFSSDGMIGSFFTGAIEVAPFVLLALFFMVSKDFPIFRRIAYLWEVLFIIFLTIAVWGVSLIALVPSDIVLAENFDALEGDIDLFVSIIIISIGALCTAFLSGACLLRQVAEKVALYIPIDPDSDLHRGGLAIIVALILLPFISLAGTGMPILLSEAHLQGMAGAESMSSPFTSLVSLVWIVIASFLIAGLFTGKTLPETLQRLGLVRPTGEEVGIACGTGVALVGVFLAIDFVIKMIFTTLGLPTTALYEQQLMLLFAGALTIPGAIIMSIVAGFGEEISIRGLIQPRYGIILASLCFAALHAFQYHWDGVLSVFFIGLIFGWMRTRWNTTTTAISHTIYDLVYFSLIMAGVVGII